jgi:hypothetical protein
MSPAETASASHAIQAQARLHHAYVLGLQLMVATREGPQVIGDWMFRLFRRQHEAKFLSSFNKLGLNGLPHAVACARYHVLSNEIGGVAVQYMEENDRKAWVRFRYPRWMYDGPTICGVPVEASRGFLRGWYAHNGVSLGNPRLGFVCVSEDMTGEFGMCGYFLEHDHDLSPAERLRFARDETPPAWDPAGQPRPPDTQWNPERLQKAARNYAMEYVRNGIVTLAEVVGEERTLELAGLAARLIGMQYWRETAALVGTADGGADVAARYLMRMFEGMGDACEMRADPGSGTVTIDHRGLRILRDIEDGSRDLLWRCWQQLWIGALRAHEQMPAAIVSMTGTEAQPAARWLIGPGPLGAAGAQIR